MEQPSWGVPQIEGGFETSLVSCSLLLTRFISEIAQFKPLLQYFEHKLAAFGVNQNADFQSCK